MTQDGSHGYTYDAEGNILAVDGGSTAQYVYDALNRRVRARASGSTSEYLYDYAGRRTSSWLNPSAGDAGEGDEGRIYWDGRQIAFRSGDGTTYFDQQDRLGTERLRTNYLGAVEAKYLSLPFGDGYSAAVNDGWGDGPDSLHFAGLDHDAESSTEHAQFRNYSSAQGRWLAPDPYDGSYDITNPQSFNRYAYALNNPLTFRDPSGLVLCDWGSSDDGGEDFDDDEDCAADGGTVVQDHQNVVVNGDGGTGDYSSWLSDGTTFTLIDYIPGVAPNNGVVGCLVKGAVVGAVGAVAVGALAVGAVTIGAPVAAVTGVLGAVAVVGGVALGLDVSQQISAGNWAGVAYDAGSVAGGAAVGLAGGGAIANGIKPGATSGWSPASWLAQRFNPSLGSFGQWLGTGPTAASGGAAAAAAGSGAALVVKKGC